MLGCICLLLLPLTFASPRQSFANEPILLFPQSTVFQFTVGVSVPIVMSKRGNIVFSFGFQFNYVLPWNVTQFEPMIIQGRQNAVSQQLSLKSTYASIEDLLDKYGWRNGRACLLRTICELADSPINRRGNDVVEEVIHLLLTPSEDGFSGNEIEMYEEAEFLGKRRGSAGCSAAYSGCATSPIDWFTKLAS